MKQKMKRSRSTRFATVSLILTALVIAVTVLVNTVFGTLAERYGWAPSMNGDVTYDVSDECYSLLETVFGKETSQEPIEIIFCKTEDEIAEDSTSSVIYHTARELEERFPNRIHVVCKDVLANPLDFQGFRSKVAPVSGEVTEVDIYTSSVVVTRGDFYQVYYQENFFVFKDGDSSQNWAYNGEKKLTAAILQALDGGERLACITNNHGEAYYDSEILSVLEDAGYQLGMLDLHKNTIPENCSLLLCFNPNTDLIADASAETSEIAVLEEYLSHDGNGFLVFLEKGTPELPNLEAFLNEWGVESCYSSADEAGNRYRYTVKDASDSLTSDGYTVYGSPVESAFAGTLPKFAVFQDATALSASQGFVKNTDGTYQKGSRTLHPVFEMGEGATSWANGRMVSSDKGFLMTLTEDALAGGGKSYVSVVSSADFCTQAFLQSAVYGNTDTVLHLCHLMGKEYTPRGLSFVPFESKDISTLTTRQMLLWTLGLTLVPFFAISAVCVVTLTKRRHA